MLDEGDLMLAERREECRIEALRAASRIVAEIAGRGKLPNQEQAMGRDLADAVTVLAAQFARWLETGER